MTFKYSEFACHREMVERLGVDGMSSDESDNEPGKRQYKILLCRWRADIVTTWLRVLDAAHLYDRIKGDPNALWGAQPRIRVISAETSSSKKFVPGLPVNAYNSHWLRRHPDVCNLVYPEPSRYIFKHPPGIVQYM